MSLNQHILILDFGSQYTQLIARRVREIGVYCEIYPYDVSSKTIQEFSPLGIILSGGPETVMEENTPRAPEIVFELGCPVLGICYGMQTMAVQLGGAVQSSGVREFGYAKVKVLGSSKLLDHVGDFLDVWMSHGDQVTQIPFGFEVIASTDCVQYAGMADEKRQFYGLQFHPEVTHTPQGMQILTQFVCDVCHCERLWTPSRMIERSIQDISQCIGGDEVVLGLSGGVDSSVVAMLLHRAVGHQLSCIFVDTGLLRLNEADEVVKTFADHFGIKVICVNAQERFFKVLEGVFDPEKKRKMIGKAFIEIFEQEAKKLKNAKWLAQGTIYPDVIESAKTKFNKSHVIKSHHNVGGLPDRMRLKLVEPIRELFKDEVRRVGVELGLPRRIVYRHPFPGPGLGVRILGEVKREYADLLRLVDHIFLNALYREGLYDQVSQAFAVFLPVKSVGVMGDERKYDYVVALRAVETIDFMTAKWACLPQEFLGKVADQIINEVSGISRVVYDISGKPPSTIEWE
jgi:GMP synthase (glutamine-hydrolysing)